MVESEDDRQCKIAYPSHGIITNGAVSRHATHRLRYLAPLVAPADGSTITAMRPSPTTLAWARRLTAVEAARKAPSDVQVHESVRVFDKLRISQSQFIGAVGFETLLRRAIGRAAVEFPFLHEVTLTGDGRVEGLDTLTAKEEGVEATIAIVAHFLDLLVSFIGEALTIRLVANAWPDASLDDDTRFA